MLRTTADVHLVEWSSKSRPTVTSVVLEHVAPSYVDRNTSIQSRLIYTREDGKVIMKGDDYTWLERGVHRPRYTSSTRNSLPSFETYCLSVSGSRAWHNTTRGCSSWISIKSRGVAVSYYHLYWRYLIVIRYTQPLGPRIGMRIHAGTDGNRITNYLIQASRKRSMAKCKNRPSLSTLPILTEWLAVWGG